ncbi:MAG: tRNA (adenosine(37)-N6)-threonylcarbamoyltransferase complex dimerization subunit type 1 TsaB [Syntrophomonas sp.]
MLILAVDSATPVAGVALLNEEKIIKEEFSNYKKTHSETLMPTIERVLNESEVALHDITAIAISTGPGSFTGLRIGMATVKGLCLAAGKPLVAVPTLDALAHNITASDALVCPLLDARKQEVYTAFYDASGICPQRQGDMMACSPQQFVELALQKGHELGKEYFLLLGDGYYPYKEFFREALGDKLILPPRHSMLLRAAAVGDLAIYKASRGDFEDPFKIKPVYIRLSEAEHRLGKGEL